MKILSTLILLALALAASAASPVPPPPVPAGMEVRIAPRPVLTPEKIQALSARAVRERQAQANKPFTAVRQRTMTWAGVGVSPFTAPPFNRAGFAPAAIGPLHSFGAFFGTTEQAMTGEQIQGTVTYLNADGFGDVHEWQRAEIIWQRVDGPLATGNLLVPGASVDFYTNNTYLHTVILESNSIAIPVGLNGRVSTQLGVRMADLGNLSARGISEGFDPAAGPLGGDIGSVTTVVDGIAMAATPLPGAAGVALNFIKPAGVPLTLQARPDAGKTWAPVNTFPAATNRVLIGVTKSNPAQYRVVQTPEP